MSRNSIIRSLITLGILIAISCSFVNLSNLIPPAATQETFVAITASQGGELTLPDKTVLNIPAGSLQNDTQVSIRKVVDTGIPGVQEEMSKVGAAYQINLGSSSLVKPATLEIPFDPTLLKNGTKPGQVFLSYFDEVAQKWVFAGGKVDTNRNVVVLEITHASLWMPVTWNWGAWIAVLNKLGQVGIVNWIQAVQLLTTSCPQTGNYVKVDSSQELNMIQGCVDQEDSQHPVLRIVNPKSFYYEIMPISGGNGYPDDTMLGPGDDVKFTASTSDPSPLIVEAQITQKAGWFLVIHEIISMLPGLDQLGIKSSQVACVAQRLSDVSYFASAVESLLVDHNGAAAAESISKFMLDANAVQRFLTAADTCDILPAPTWSPEGIEQIGAAVSTIMSSSDYIANYFAQNSGAQVSFKWNLLRPDSSPSEEELGFLITTDNGNSLKVINADGTGERELLNFSSISEFAWANKEAKIAFIEQNTEGGTKKTQIELVDLPSGNVSTLVGPEQTPFKLLGTYFYFHDIHWSLDDQSLFFIAWDGRAQGHTIRYLSPVSDSGNQVSLPAQGSLWSLDVSPKDNRLVFRKWWNGAIADSLESIGADGTEAAVILQPDPGRMISSPKWSPDGSQIAVQDKSSIYIINPDGSNIRRIADENSFKNQQGAYVPMGDLSWSPDGKWIILTAELKSINDDDIWMVSTSDGTVKDLTNSPGDVETNPSWSPDGEWIAFVRNKNTIWIYDTSTNEAKTLLEEPSSNSIDKLIWKP